MADQLVEQQHLAAKYSFARLYMLGQKRATRTDCARFLHSARFARAADIRAVRWELVVIDEAHKLRNAYRPEHSVGGG